MRNAWKSDVLLIFSTVSRALDISAWFLKYSLVISSAWNTRSCTHLTESTFLPGSVITQVETLLPLSSAWERKRGNCGRRERRMVYCVGWLGSVILEVVLERFKALVRKNFASTLCSLLFDERIPKIERNAIKQVVFVVVGVYCFTIPRRSLAPGCILQRDMMLSRANSFCIVDVRLF